MDITFFILNFLAITTCGVFFHYIHNIFKKGIIIHVLGAINESTWEHLKLAFWPMFFSALMREVFGIADAAQNFWFAISISIIFTMVLIPVMYYFVRSIIKKEVTIVSIAIYYICVLIGLLVELYITNLGIGNNVIGILVIGLIIFFIALFTYKPPRNFLFKDPVNNRYGDID